MGGRGGKNDPKVHEVIIDDPLKKKTTLTLRMLTFFMLSYLCDKGEFHLVPQFTNDLLFIRIYLVLMKKSINLITV